ncbi:MAG: response regulator [Myxococcota bacterium]
MAAPSLLSARPPEDLGLLAAAPYPALLFDGTGALEGWNDAAEALFGTVLLAARSRGMAALLAGETGSLPMPADGRRWEVWAQTERGRVPVELSLSPRTRGGTVAFVHDLSTARRAARALEAARRQAEHTSATKTRFLAMMSHELRTPLHAVLGHAELLLDGRNLEPEQRAMLRVIERSAETLSALIEDLLDLPRIERGEVALEAAPFAPRELAAELEASVGTKARELGVRLRVHVDDALPAQLLGDRRRVIQILTNLANNAVRFAPEGHVDLRLESGSTHATLRLVVRDDGVGMTDAVRARIFEPYFSHGAGDIPSSEGLGLAIVRTLVKALGGSLDVRTAPGEGTEFRVELPLEVARPSAPMPANPPLTGGGRVLVVDDDALNRRVACGLLEKAGFDASEVGSGPAAIAHLEQHDVDLVLMDVDMPGMDGLEATRRIHAADRAAARPETPIVALTAHAMPELESRCREAGMLAMQRKPVRRATLVPFVLAYKRRRVLVVDDDADLRPLLRAFLETARVEVHEAASAQEAERCLASLGLRAPQVLLVDLELPGRDGASLAKDLRAAGWAGAIFALSGHAPDEVRARGGDAIDGVLTKPVRRDVLLTEVLAACDRPRRLIRG